MRTADTWYSWMCRRQSRIKLRDRNMNPIRTCSAQTVRYRTAECTLLRLHVKWKLASCFLRVSPSRKAIFSFRHHYAVATGSYESLHDLDPSVVILTAAGLVVPSEAKEIPILETSLLVVFPNFIFLPHLGQSVYRLQDI
jgi:hypothetical protein